MKNSYLVDGVRTETISIALSREQNGQTRAPE